MRRMLIAGAVLGTLCAADPALAVLKSSMLTITDRGNPIPGATITLTRPRPRTAPAATASRQPPAYRSEPSNQPAQPHGPPPPSPPQQAYQPYPPAERPAQQTWIVAHSDQTGRVSLRFDDREATPGTLVDVTVYYANGVIRQLVDVPIEAILADGQFEIAGGPEPAASGQPYPGQAYEQPYSSAAPYGGPGYAPPPPAGGGVALPNIGISIGRGRGDRNR